MTTATIALSIIGTLILVVGIIGILILRKSENYGFPNYIPPAPPAPKPITPLERKQIILDYLTDARKVIITAENLSHVYDKHLLQDLGILRRDLEAVRSKLLFLDTYTQTLSDTPTKEEVPTISAYKVPPPFPEDRPTKR